MIKNKGCIYSHRELRLKRNDKKPRGKESKPVQAIDLHLLDIASMSKRNLYLITMKIFSSPLLYKLSVFIVDQAKC